MAAADEAGIGGLPELQLVGGRHDGILVGHHDLGVQAFLSRSAVAQAWPHLCTHRQLAAIGGSRLAVAAI
jgi:hypothetical protein